MTHDNILVLAFDALGSDRLSVYGGKIEAPNVQSLAKRGTIYKNYISCAASTAMNLIGMFTGLYPHQTGIRLFDGRNYSPLKDMKQKDRKSLLLVCLEDLGYSTYFLWSSHFMAEVNGRNIYKVKSWRASTTKFMPLDYDNSATKNYGQLKRIIENADEPWFVFVLFPAVASGEFVGASKYTTKMKCDEYIYGADDVLGKLMAFVNDKATIYLTADHGHSHGEHGEIGYAMPLRESILRIPLISSKPHGSIVRDYVSNTNFRNIILNQKLRVDEYIYSFNVYSEQESKRVAVRKGDWKYILNSKGWAPYGIEELYDLSVDPGECCNLLRPTSAEYSDFRHKHGMSFRDYLPRADWDEIDKVHEELKGEAVKIWPPLLTSQEKLRWSLHRQRKKLCLFTKTYLPAIRSVIRNPKLFSKVLKR